jgi:poly(A) polymerase
MVRRLEGPERAATGAIKDAVFNDPDLPDDRDAALQYLDRVKREAMAERKEPAT